MYKYTYLRTYIYIYISYISYTMFETLNFQRIVLIIAGVLFAGFMVTVIYSMLKANAIGEWPPVIANCPDNWVMNSSGKCENVNGIFKTGSGDTCVSIIPSSAEFSGAGGMCEKYKWSKNCGVNWDGISNNPGVCLKRGK